VPEVLTDEDVEPVFLIPKGRSLDAARIEVVGSPEFKVRPKLTYSMIRETNRS